MTKDTLGNLPSHARIVYEPASRSKKANGSHAPSGGSDTDNHEFSIADLAGVPVPVREDLITGILPFPNVALLYGDGGTGKSLLALQLCVACAFDGDFLGHSVMRGPALMWTAEDDKNEIHRRADAIIRERGMAYSDLQKLRVRSLAGADAIMAQLDGGRARLETTEVFKAFEASIARLRPVLVVADTLADIFGGDEVSRTQARQFIGFMRGLALKYRCTILLLAHPSIAGMASGTGSSGSTGWNNSVRSRLYYERVKDAKGSEDDPDLRRLVVKKNNYGRTGFEVELRWRRGVFVKCGADDVAEQEARADASFLHLMKIAIERGNKLRGRTGRGYAPAVLASLPEAKLSNDTLAAAMVRLLGRGAVVEVPDPDSRSNREMKMLVVRDGFTLRENEE